MSRYEKTQYPGIYLDKRSGVFYMRDTVHININESVFVDKSLKTKQITVARDRANAVRQKLIKGELKRDEIAKSRKTFDDAFDLLETVQAPKAKNTAAQTQAILKHLRPWFSEHCPHLDSFEKDFEETWAKYKVAQAEKSAEKNKQRRSEGKPAVPPRKLGHDRRYLVMALSRALTKGWIKRKFTKSDFDLLEAVEPIGKFVEDADITKLLAFLRIKHEKTYLQVLMAVTMGMRISEILHLRTEEVRLSKREIVLDPNRLKTRQRRKVPIPISNVVYPLLRHYVGDATGPYVFPAIRFQFSTREGVADPDSPQDDNRYWWDQAREKTGVDCRFHDLRHTAITNALAAGMAPLTACKIFGATQEVINEIYDHVKPEASQGFRSMFDGKFEV